jgi:hypothetical protein
MLPTVQLDNQFFLKTDKINNVWANRSLTAKFATIELTHAQMAPKNLFGVGKMAP